MYSYHNEHVYCTGEYSYNNQHMYCTGEYSYNNKHVYCTGEYSYNNKHVYCTGEYSCLSVDMVFKRQLSYYIVTIYVPTFMIVCVSWMSFWLDHKSAPARVALTGIAG